MGNFSNCSSVANFQNNTHKLTKHVLGKTTKHSTSFHPTFFHSALFFPLDSVYLSILNLDFFFFCFSSICILFRKHKSNFHCSDKTQCACERRMTQIEGKGLFWLNLNAINTLYNE